MAKFGAGHVAAMGRLGIKELRNAINPSRESVADSELGLYGSLTPGEIASGKGPEQESMSLEGMRKEAKEKEAGKEKEQGKEQGKERGGMEM